MATQNRRSIYSFGDKGVTASVSGFGRLLRVSRHFAGQDFGYCVDHPSIPEPYFVVDRMVSLLSVTTDTGDSIGIDPKLHIPDISDEPSAEFVHDRWPLFTIISGDFMVKIQFFASCGVIYQTYEFIHDGTDSQPPKLTMDADLLIRQLDFIDDRNRFNEAHRMDDTYKTEILYNQKGIKRSHYMDEGEVALFIVACSNGQLLTFEQVDDENRGEEQEGDRDTQTDENDTQHQQESNGEGKTLKLVWSKKASRQMETKKSLKVTFAYRLEFLSEQGESTGPPITAEMMSNATQHVNLDHFGKHNFTLNPDVDPFLRRNLEYILSVCSIPVIAAGDEGEPPAIAFTCGDMDGHRVVTAASFYCFEFLLLALDYFKSQQHPCASPGFSCCICNMKQRIMKVCEGHLKWLFGKKYRNLSENPSAPHCWVNGRLIDKWEGSQYLARKSLVEVPFQIIKAGDFFDRDNNWKIPHEVELTVQAWIKELDQRNKLDRYAFPRYSEEPTDSFYFTDHVFIWRALKSAESLGLKSELNVTESEGGDVYAKKGMKRRNYSSVEVQKQILKRFTTENPISKKRMIAVSKSAAHNRFLLRTKDTGLFYAMDLGLFDKPEAEKSHYVWQNKIDTWKNLVDCQVDHKDNDDRTWDEPVRFALSFIMAQTGKQINRRPVGEICSNALSVLLQSAWPNGAFPGQLDADQRPILYDDEITRDTYWANSFEILYTLMKYSGPPFPDKGAPKSQCENEIMTRMREVTPTSDSELLALIKEHLEYRNGERRLDDPTIYTMKQSFPLNNVMKPENIVELEDEWLYNEPEFFSCTLARSGNSSSASSSGGTLPLFLDAMQQRSERIVVIDVPRSKRSRRIMLGVDDLMEELQTSTELETFMHKKRSPSTAKKRLCALFATHPDANRVYGHNVSENLDMATFANRHVSYSKFFEQVTAPGLNKWTTELHLSFYEIDKKGLSSNVNNPFFRLRAPAENESSGRLIRTVTSFRFDGDFFDRYWTCHFLESDPQMASSFNAKREVSTLLQAGVREQTRNFKAPWRQRRVLELLLFGRIMLRMQKCTADILEDAKLNAWRKPGGGKAQQGTEDIHLRSSTEFDYDNFRVASWWCQEYQRMLRMIEKDIRENLHKVELWLNREKEFGSERPRWSFNDESRYGGVISKLLIENNRRVEELKRSHASISSFNISLNEKFQIARNDFDQRQADNIRRFTYVTVVFLPLSFATGVFSMSQAPANQTLISMAVTAVVAVATTLLLLLSAKTLERLYERCCRGLRRLVDPELKWVLQLGMYTFLELGRLFVPHRILYRREERGGEVELGSIEGESTR